MVDRQRLLEELRELKKQIRENPEVRAKYDLDGDGQISGEEWEQARKAVISYLEAEEARDADEKNSQQQSASGGVADKVFRRIKENAQPEKATSGTLFTEPSIVVQQKVEDLELLTGFEGRNAYSMATPDGREMGQAKESDTGVTGTFVRSILGNRRPFIMWINVHKTNEIVTLQRRFDFIFSKVDVSENDEPIGTVQQRFGILNRKYDLVSFFAQRELSVVGPLFKPWTFNVVSGDRQVGSIKKQWSGLLKEAFTKSDNFLVSFDDPKLTATERKLILAAAIAIDIDYFEKGGK